MEQLAVDSRSCSNSNVPPRPPRSQASLASSADAAAAADNIATQVIQRMTDIL